MSFTTTCIHGKRMKTGSTYTQCVDRWSWLCKSILL